ncbi:ATP-binding protein [Ruminococcaceae bacterium OttesenSCG-928-D13]|nr:ATP-binding protein [Ruminococcaceae bacterium OttesenSCG-928-D13]
MSCCILIAGMPASGKTTFAASLSKALDLPMVSKDRIKELMYDHIGYTTHAEKVKLSTAATGVLYYFAESLMRTGRPFILENNFENVTKPGLQRLLEEYRYRPVTVRFGGDVRVIYERYLAREQTAGRHGGHRASNAWPPQNAGVLAVPLTMEDFVAGVAQRGIAEFTVGGEEILVDAADFTRVSYEDITAQVRRLLGRYTGPPEIR